MEDSRISIDSRDSRTADRSIRKRQFFSYLCFGDAVLHFAIGDIHGSHRKLTSLVARCRDFASGHPHRFIFLGDYVDRGEASCQVVDTLIGMQTDRTPPVLLKGNHEQMLLDATGSAEAALTWFANGGAATLESYGVTNAFELPQSHIAWFRHLLLRFDDGQRLYVHAGVDPSRPLEKQKPKHLLWMREPFLSSEVDFGRLVVHGHSPTENQQPDLRSNRLNIDTGAVYGGPLTAAVFDSEQKMPIDFLASDIG